jgi:hypothetical protein
MTFRTVISSLALVSAMTFSGSVFAQAMIGDVTIPEESMADFQAKCAAIASAATETLAEPSNADDDTDATQTGSVVAPENDDPDPANEDNLDALLASLTPEQCKEAGLLSGPASVQSGGQ